MKKIIALILALCMVFALTACGQSTTATTAETPAANATAADATASSGEEGPSGKLVLWECTSDRGVLAEAYANAFMEKYPNIEFSYEAKPENMMSTALTTAFESGNGPDVYAHCGTKNAVFEGQVSAGNAVELTDIVDMSLFEKDGNPTAVSEICYIDGTLYAVPSAAIDTRTVYYNVDIFENMGYAVPTSLAEFEALCDQMLADGIVPLTLAAADWASIMHAWDFLMCTQDGGPDFFTRLSEGTAEFNEDVNVKGLELLVDWNKKGYFSVSSAMNDANAACMEFASGGTGMIICGSWLLSTIRNSNENLNFDVFKLPNVADNATYACTTANGGYSINPNSQNMEAALLFIEWMTTVEGQQTFVDAQSAIPALEETPSKDHVATEIGTADVLLSCNEETIFHYGAKAEEYFELNIMNVFGGLITPQEFCDNVWANID